MKEDLGRYLVIGDILMSFADIEQTTEMLWYDHVVGKIDIHSGKKPAVKKEDLAKKPSEKFDRERYDARKNGNLYNQGNRTMPCTSLTGFEYPFDLGVFDTI